MKNGRNSLETPEAFSKNLFGRTHRLTVWRAVIDATIEPPHYFYQTELATTLQQALELAPSVTHTELRSMRDFGMIEAASDHYGAPYRRAESPIWQIVGIAIKVCEELSSPQ